MVMTFVLHPLSHYNSITELSAQFLLSFIEDLTIDFPSHIILSLMNVYRDTTTSDKLIFPFAITRIIHHFSTSYPESSHFTVMATISTTFIQPSEAQLRLKQPQTEMTTPPAHSAPSFSSASGVMLQAIMVQLERMDAHLDTLTTKLYQVNTCVSHISQQQAHMGGFTVSLSPSPSPQASEDEDDDGGSGDNDDGDDEDEDTSFSSDKEMTASQ